MIVTCITPFYLYTLPIGSEMVALMNFQKRTVDEALRVFQAHFLMPVRNPCWSSDHD